MSHKLRIHESDAEADATLDAFKEKVEGLAQELGVAFFCTVATTRIDADNDLGSNVTTFLAVPQCIGTTSTMLDSMKPVIPLLEAIRALCKLEFKASGLSIPDFLQKATNEPAMSLSEIAEMMQRRQKDMRSQEDKDNTPAGEDDHGFLMLEL